ncbi:DUF742 domain-containing protein [Prauserella muralis]|uniref:Uncharacterized protein n=1 Tax=Prauserella muralis TaxID=588067 RepID=A0A2V4B851_9PSEU|nr:DUF742 domain-containing protein [Prauserella muralis]PXY31534.1 hypothetical protein BAY60_03930 [Prauserella muralis]TWE14117.1 uncharacterized protein DUF742 [Prauserella muralis]
MGTSDEQRKRADGRPVGRSGARFPSARQRERLGYEEQQPEAQEDQSLPPDDGPRQRRVGRSGARFPSARQLERLEPEEQAALPPDPDPEPAPPARTGDPPPRTERVLAAADRHADAEDDAAEQHRLRVRPYVLTKGRTRARDDLHVETLISTDQQAPWNREQLSSEYMAVGRLCRQPRSVAEVAALLSVPLGVARVLISDLAEAGYVHVHSSMATEGGRPDYVLMQRVLEGLHRL